MSHQPVTGLSPVLIAIRLHLNDTLQDWYSRIEKFKIHS